MNAKNRGNKKLESIDFEMPKHFVTIAIQTGEDDASGLANAKKKLKELSIDPKTMISKN